MRSLFVISAVVLAGCVEAVAEPITIRNSDGVSQIAFECPSHITCLAEAGIQCPNGYVVAESDEHNSTEANLHANQYVARASVKERYHGYMVISCRASTVSFAGAK